MGDLDIYRKQGMGQASGWGERPALLIVDFVNGFNDADAFGGGNIDAAIKKTVWLRATFRRHRLPVAYTRVIYADDGSDAGMFCKKAPRLSELTEDNPMSQIVPELAPEPGEYIVRKTGPSAFFGTNFQNWFTLKKVDTIVYTACTTSGCVRASVVDGLSYNYHNTVAVDCVGDRAIGPHEANLFDMAQKYADLHISDEVISMLDQKFGFARAAE